MGALIRSAYFGDADPEVYNFALDYIWYLWCGKDSPVFDKDKMATFERYFIENKCTHKEIKGHYYTLRDKPEICDMILDEFGIEGNFRHIINGHVPVLTIEGENPVKAGGKLMVIDGGFSKSVPAKDWHCGLHIGISQPWFPARAARTVHLYHKKLWKKRQDIKSTVEMVEMANHRMMVKRHRQGCGTPGTNKRFEGTASRLP
ncbi:MAG: fructose-1,6-bisphosphatase [Porphyromonadaceae bacterium]|nr:MAG: fructose-1,6-bisphosphatase [Porphyromonadaceae bacterium]